MKCVWHCCNKEVSKKKSCQKGPQKLFCGTRCRTKQAVSDFRKRLKEKAVAYKGGRCIKCGYSKCVTALHFHHKRDKNFAISKSGITRTWEQVVAELDKCDLLCANCHAEEHEFLQGRQISECR